MNMSVRDLIKKAGGAEEISAASQRTRFPVSASAVHKWRRNGIPDEHWPLFIKKAAVKVEDIFRANQLLRRAKAVSEVRVERRVA